MEIYNTAFEITETATGKTHRIHPVAAENCMKPGTLAVTPVTRTETAEAIHFCLPGQEICIAKKDLADAKIVIREVPYHPTLPSYDGKKGCTPCTNCGHCSW